MFVCAACVRAVCCSVMQVAICSRRQHVADRSRPLSPNSAAREMEMPAFTTLCFTGLKQRGKGERGFAMLLVIIITTIATHF